MYPPAVSTPMPKRWRSSTGLFLLSLYLAANPTNAQFNQQFTGSLWYPQGGTTGGIPVYTNAAGGIPTVVFHCGSMPAICLGIRRAQGNPTWTGPRVLHYDYQQGGRARSDIRRDKVCGGWVKLAKGNAIYSGWQPYQIVQTTKQLQKQQNLQKAASGAAGTGVGGTGTPPTVPGKPGVGQQQAAGPAHPAQAVAAPPTGSVGIGRGTGQTAGRGRSKSLPPANPHIQLPSLAINQLTQAVGQLSVAGIGSSVSPVSPVSPAVLQPGAPQSQTSSGTNTPGGPLRSSTAPVGALNLPAPRRSPRLAGQPNAQPNAQPGSGTTTPVPGSLLALPLSLTPLGSPTGTGANTPMLVSGANTPGGTPRFDPTTGNPAGIPIVTGDRCPDPQQPVIVNKFQYVLDQTLKIPGTNLVADFLDPVTGLMTKSGITWTCDEWPVASTIEGGAGLSGTTAASTMCAPMAWSCNQYGKALQAVGPFNHSEQDWQGKVVGALREKIKIMYGITTLTGDAVFQIQIKLVDGPADPKNRGWIEQGGIRMATVTDSVKGKRDFVGSTFSRVKRAILETGLDPNCEEGYTLHDEL